MGHSVKKLSVNETYGEISDDELREAIDSMTFDNGVIPFRNSTSNLQIGKFVIDLTLPGSS